MMHNWSDSDFDWKALNGAINIIGPTCRKYGLLGGQIKEKYGTLRFYAMFGYLSLHTLIYPGYVYSQFPKWLWTLDIKYIGPILRFFFERPFVWWQKKVYNYAYQKAVKKYPHIRKEILCAADYPEFIKNYKELIK